MIQKLHIKKEVIGFSLIILICFIIFILDYLNSNHYEGQFSGVISDGERSQIVVCDIVEGAFTVVKDIEPSEYIEYATINDKGNKIAYTKWNDTLNNQYVIIESGLGSKVIYGKIDDTHKNSKIYTPMLIHEGKDLICVRAEENDGYPNEKLVLFNINDQKEQIVDSGELAIINTDKENQNNKFSISEEPKADGVTKIQINDQIELDRFLKKYHARQIELKDAGTRLFVRYSRPAFDAKNNQIIYAKTLYRNIARQGEGVILSSEIWTYNLDSDLKQFIYEAEDKCLVGKIDIKPNGSAVVFSESTETKENGRIMELSLDGTGKIKCLVEPDEEHYANLDAMYLDDQTITYLSVAKDDWLENAVRYVIDLQNMNTREITLEYENKPELIKFFNRIYQ